MLTVIMQIILKHTTIISILCFSVLIIRSKCKKWKADPLTALSTLWFLVFWRQLLTLPTHPLTFLYHSTLGHSYTLGLAVLVTLLCFDTWRNQNTASSCSAIWEEKVSASEEAGNIGLQRKSSGCETVRTRDDRVKSARERGELVKHPGNLAGNRKKHPRKQAGNAWDHQGAPQQGPGGILQTWSLVAIVASQ